MKRVLIIAFVFACIFGLVGCDPGTNTIDGDALLKNTVKIELFNYANTTPNLRNLNGKNSPLFDFSKATFIAALDEEHFEDVIQNIAEQECFVYGKALNEPIGKRWFYTKKMVTWLFYSVVNIRKEKNSQNIMESATYSTKTAYLLNILEESAAIMLIC